MNRNEQIEEMAREICSEYDCIVPCQSCAYYGYANCRNVWSAEKLYIAGYRKASEVAREIFAEIQAEIKAALDSNYKALPKVELSEELWSCVRGRIDCLQGLEDFIEKLKKKYTEVNNEQKRTD